MGNLNLVGVWVALPPVRLNEEKERMATNWRQRKRAFVEVTTSQELKYTSVHDSARNSHCTSFCYPISQTQLLNGTRSQRANDLIDVCKVSLQGQSEESRKRMGKKTSRPMIIFLLWVRKLEK